MADLFALEKQFVEKPSKIDCGLVIHILTSFYADHMLHTKVKEHTAYELWCTWCKIHKIDHLGLRLKFFSKFNFFDSYSFSTWYFEK